MQNELQFTGERCVPNRTCHPLTLAEHLIRYSFASQYAKVGNILDAACGTGYGMKVMSWLGATVDGVDVSQEALDEARRVVPANSGLRKTDLEKEALTVELLASDRYYDMVTSFETIEHLDDPNLFLQGVKNILKENGKFIYSIPLQNPSKYHKVVYDFESAYKLIGQYFEHEELFIQESMEIVKFSRMNGNIAGLNKRGVFIIGVCHKKK